MEELLAAVPRGLLAAYVTLVGATVGSFLNVVIARVPVGESVVRPRSRCPRCKQAIAWYDNLPVLSWLVLRGRCRGCALPISLRYPVVELLGGLLGWAAWQRHGFTLHALAEFAFTALLLALAAIDLDTWLLPNALTWPLLALGLGVGALGLGAAPSFSSAAWGGGLGFGAFFLVSWLGEKALKKEALGFGDVWLLAGLGAWLGALALLPLVLLASTQGAVVGILLILVGKAQLGPTSTPTSTPTEEEEWIPPRNAVPFGPFLVAGALEWLWFSDALIRLVPLFEAFR
jgi:leader peptidase (prepilin peptidase)/N-methyltransferase